MTQVSVIISCFNGESYVRKAIESSLAQSVRDLEVIVVDDGSTDGSRAVVEGIVDPRLRLLSRSNGGISSARNAGARAAQGEWLAFLDCDDWWETEKLRHQFEVVNGPTRPHWVYSSARLFAEEGPLIAALPAQVEGWILPELVINNVISGSASSVLVRRDALEAVGGFDESVRFAEDWDCWMRLGARYPIGRVQDHYDVNILRRRTSHGSNSDRMLRVSLEILERAFSTYARHLGHLRPKAEANTYYLAALNYNASGDPHNERKALRALWHYRPFDREVYRRYLRSFVRLPSRGFP